MVRVDVVFGTQSGLFAVDTGNGTILALPQAASKTFDPTYAGSYTVMRTTKRPAPRRGQGNIESGTPSEGKGTVTIAPRTA